MRDFFKFNFERYEEQKILTLDGLDTLVDNIIYFRKRARSATDGINYNNQQTNNVIYLNKLDKKL